MSNSELKTLGLALACVLLFAVVLEARRRQTSEKVTEQIVGGVKVNAGEYPFIARMDMWDDHFWYVLKRCNAVILDEWHILTSNTCVHVHSTDWNDKNLQDPGQMFMRYGCVDYTKCGPGPNYWNQVDKIWAWKPKKDGDPPVDMAMLRTYEKIEFNNNSNKVLLDCVGPPEECYCKDAATYYLAGIGDEDNTVKTEFRRWAYPRVAQMDGNTINGSCAKSQPAGTLNEMTFCAGNSTKGGCHGDVAAPLFRKLSNGQFLLKGLMKDITEEGKCKLEQGNLYADVQANKKWIKGCLINDTHEDCHARIKVNASIWPILRTTW